MTIPYKTSFLAIFGYAICTFCNVAGRKQRIELMNHVITTSAVTKTMLGQELPTRIDKSGNAASDEEKEIAERYYKDILGFIN
jgi:hypothetical protein